MILIHIMKLSPKSSKFAATAILLATAGATFTVTPAYASEPSDKSPTTVAQTVSKYDLESYKSSTFTPPKTESWAVAYKTVTPADELEPAEKALLEQNAELAQKQKTILEDEAAEVRAEEQRIAAEKAAIEKAAAEKAAAEKAERDRIEAERVAAEKAAAEKAQQEADAAAEATRIAAQSSAIQAPAAARVAGTPAPVGGTATATPMAASQAPVAGSAKEKMVQIAHQNLGVPYVWGGTTQAGWDCSGMVGFVYSQATGKSLPRTVNGMVGSGMLTPTGAPQPGDIVVFANGGDAYHVGIYIGGGQMIHAPVPGQVTQVSAVWGTPSYYSI